MKKVIIVFIVAIAAGVAIFFVARELLYKSQLRTRCEELGGLVGNSGENVRTALERDWWHRLMPASEDDYPPGEFSPDINYARGRTEWFNTWRDENSEHGGMNVRRVIGDKDIEFLNDKYEFAGQTDLWRVKVTWHLGVPNGQWGERVTHEILFKFDDQFWRIFRIWEVARVEAGPPPSKN